MGVFEMKDTTDTARSTLYNGLIVRIVARSVPYNGLTEERLKTNFYDKKNRLIWFFNLYVAT